MKTYIVKKFPVEPGGLVEGMEERLLRKWKLFLCSTDIQVGDEVFYHNSDKVIVIHREEGESGWLFINPDPGPSIDPKELTKIVGEISQGAIWINEGDEFEESEVEFIAKHRSFPDQDLILDTPDENSQWMIDHSRYTIQCLIKCGQCKTFH